MKEKAGNREKSKRGVRVEQNDETTTWVEKFKENEVEPREVKG